MKQIGNWVFGSFFRTIGRLLVFILLGFIIANLVDFGSIKDNFRITDLFFDKVDALSLDGQIVGEVMHSTTALEVESLIDDYTGFNRYFNHQTIDSNSADYVVFVVSGFTGYYKNYDYEVDAGGHHYEGFEMKELIYSIKLINSSGYAWTSCEMQDNRIVCPMIHNNGGYGGLEFIFNSDGTEIYISFKINIYAILYNKDTNAVINSIDSQTQQQQQQHNETQSYLEDSNTTQAENEATEFFEDFEQEDFGGLSAIITAPLNTIRSLLNSSCTNLVLPLPYVNENLTLPCMTSIYTTHFGAFFTIYQTIILAIIAYRCIRSIYYDIHGFTNPNDDRIEVLDL